MVPILVQKNISSIFHCELSVIRSKGKLIRRLTDNLLCVIKLLETRLRYLSENARTYWHIKVSKRLSNESVCEFFRCGFIYVTV